MRLSLLLLLGCTTNKGDPKDTGPFTDSKNWGPWHVVADDIEGGVLLSAWSDGDTLRMVGGDLGGGAGIAVHGDADALCVERDITDRALWWIHGNRPGRWVAVGEAGTVLLEEDGIRTRIDVPTDATLFGTWMEDDTIWAVGGRVGSGQNIGEIWRYDGDAWETVAADLPGVLFKVWSNWFVGQDSLYQRVDGALESTDVNGRLLTIRGRSADDVWAVGGLTGPIVMHFDGTGWSDVNTAGLGQAINGVFTGEGEEVWLAGNYGVTALWTGEGWEQPDLPLTTDHLHAVWRHGGDTWWMGGDLFASGNNHGTILRHSTKDGRPSISDCP